MSGHPWMKWYPADWRADPRLRMCSLAARGLWIELLGYMHEAEPYGHLVINGRTPQPKEIAALVGAPLHVVAKALEELRDQGVWSVGDDGTIFSRRMVRDKARAAADSANGKRGGNPRLKGGGLPGGITQGVNPPDKAQKPEARSQKPEGREREEGAPAAQPPATPPPDPPVAPDGEPLRAAVEAWNELADQHGLPRVQALTVPRQRALRRRLADAGGLDGWRTALAKVAASRFLTGANDRGWRADFDFVTREAAFTRLMEGKYDDQQRRDGEQFRNGFAQLVAEGGV